MRRRGEPPELLELRATWGRWTAIVELFARRRRARRRVDPRAYATLHHGLLASCRALAASADGSPRDLYRTLEGLAEPWLTPRTLARADREILFDLLIRCRRAERDLGGRPPLRIGPAPALVAGAVLTAVVLIPRAADRGWFLPSPVLARGWVAAGMRMMGGLDQLQQSFVLGIIAVVVCVYMVSYAARS